MRDVSKTVGEGDYDSSKNTGQSVHLHARAPKCTCREAASRTRCLVRLGMRTERHLSHEHKVQVRLEATNRPPLYLRQTFEKERPAGRYENLFATEP